MPIDVYIVGCERSGSTLLSNIIDSASETEVYIEPYNLQMSGIKELAIRTDKLALNLFSRVNTYYNTYNSKLYSKKYPFLYRPSKNVFLRKIDYIIYKFLKKLTYFKILPASKNLNNYFELNFSQIFSGQNPTKKKHTLKKTVVKEFRFNYKLDFLKYNNPNAQYIILIRNPIDQANSIVELFNKGSLKELYSIISNNELMVILSAKGNLMDLYQKINKDNIIDKVLFYLLCNYKNLVEKSKSLFLNNRVITYKQLVQEDDLFFKNIFDWIDIEFDHRVINYIETSRTKVSNMPNNHPYLKYSQLKKKVKNNNILKNEIASRVKDLDINSYYLKYLNLEIDFQDEH